MIYAAAVALLSTMWFWYDATIPFLEELEVEPHASYGFPFNFVASFWDCLAALNAGNAYSKAIPAGVWLHALSFVALIVFMGIFIAQSAGAA